MTVELEQCVGCDKGCEERKNLRKTISKKHNARTNISMDKFLLECGGAHENSY